jgi:hypothetical protein
MNHPWALSNLGEGQDIADLAFSHFPPYGLAPFQQRIAIKQFPVPPNKQLAVEILLLKRKETHVFSRDGV